MPITLKDIAKMVGVAESTVSRAINGKPGVGKETKQKILEIAKKYDFQPNKLAQGLAKQETHILALLIPGLSKGNYSSLVENIEYIAEKDGYQIILCNTQNDLKKEKKYLNLLQEKRVDGAVILGGEIADQHIVNTVLRGHKNIVLVNRLCEEILIPTILIDASYGAYLATEYLINLGFENIGLITAAKNDEYIESEKIKGYKKALKDNMIEYNNELIIKTDGSREAGYLAFTQLVNIDINPDSFFVTSDLLTLGLIESIKMGGFFIPQDYPVVTYGDTLINSIIEPELTRVVEPLEKAGKLAAEVLINLINDDQAKEEIKVLKPTLKIGKSTKY
ncbi:MAG: LacI family transcriptional regulator [Halanaerobiales bacterium]|nr:LacI family transcriptional regulator [Halanaerobiales bacterium]